MLEENQEQEKQQEHETEEIAIRCYVCRTIANTRWAVDPDYVVCPNCFRLYKIADHEPAL